MDALTYHYQLNTNKLTHVTDAVSAGAHAVDIDNQAPANYSYDKIGNLIADQSEGITAINWTVYGKIRNISKTGTQIRYAYDAGGNRVHKQVTGTGATEDVYIRDAQGNALAIYRIVVGVAEWQEQHLYGSSRLGMMRYGGAIPAAAAVVNSSVTTLVDSVLYGRVQYELSNHLGNVLAVVSDKKIGVSSLSDSSLTDHYVAEVLSLQDYYAFGMGMPGRGYQFGSYRYGFNGKENDGEVKGEGNQQDYGMRIYDPRVGKFLSIDPLIKNYPELTPYQFASNSPIENSDLDGAESLSEIKAGLARKWEMQMKVASFNDANEKAKEAKIRATMRYLATTPPASVNVITRAPDEVSDKVKQLRREHHLDPETGKKTAMGRLFMSRTYQNFNDNLVERMAGMAVGEGAGRLLFKGGSLLFKVESEAAKGGSKYLYHYTSEAAAQSISKTGLRTGKDGFLYLTNKSGLSPLQAQIELALPANRALPTSILRIDASGLSPSIIRRVQGNLPGMGAGGGTEFLFNQNISANLIKIVK